MTDATTENERLILKLSGGNAESGSLPLPQYWLTLQGWNDFFRIIGGLYQQAATTAEGEPVQANFQIRVIAERRGSYEIYLEFILVAAVGGVIGNRTDAIVKWTFAELLKWYRQTFKTYKDAKAASTNVEEIVEALEELTKKRKIPLTPQAVAVHTPMGSSDGAGVLAKLATID